MKIKAKFQVIEKWFDRDKIKQILSSISWKVEMFCLLHSTFSSPLTKKSLLKNSADLTSVWMPISSQIPGKELESFKPELIWKSPLCSQTFSEAKLWGFPSLSSENIIRKKGSQDCKNCMFWRRLLKNLAWIKMMKSAFNLKTILNFLRHKRSFS